MRPVARSARRPFHDNSRPLLNHVYRHGERLLIAKPATAVHLGQEEAGRPGGSCRADCRARRLHVDLRPASSSPPLDVMGIGSCRPSDGPAHDDNDKCAVAASRQVAQEAQSLVDSPRLHPPMRAGSGSLDAIARRRGPQVRRQDDTELPRNRILSCGRLQWLCGMPGWLQPRCGVFRNDIGGSNQLRARHHRPADLPFGATNERRAWSCPICGMSQLCCSPQSNCRREAAF
jgi:hypothetical protein